MRLDALNYRDKEISRGQQDHSKPTVKDTVYLILELSLCRKKGQPADTVMKSMSLHLKTPDNHSEVPTDVH